MLTTADAAANATVERIDTPTPEAFFDRFVAQNRPVVIEGAMVDWPALRDWTPDGLRTKIGDKTVKVNRRRDGVYESADPVKMTFTEYLEILDDPERREHYYLNGLHTGRALRELAGDFTVPAFMQPAWADKLFVWLGYNSKTINHYHSHQEAVLCQIAGEKRVVLYAPTDTASMYSRGFFDYDHNCSLVDAHDPDLEKFPKFRRATPIECTLAAGDMLFIPVHWWHAVHGLELSFSGTFFWGARLRDWHFPNPGFRCGVHLALRRVPALRRRLLASSHSAAS